ncbi:Vacuolar protein sorting-associated protein 11 [Malassezia sp. CBS 17886]|nr:Vacuolar protein sorting-associated protein 11 [Malassezia sp. CBS 17886]
MSASSHATAPRARSLPSWRNVSFFHTSALPDAARQAFLAALGGACADVLDMIYVPRGGALWASPHGALLVGLRSGRIVLLDAAAFAPLAAWQAHGGGADGAAPDPASGASLHAVAFATGAVVSVGTDGAQHTPQLRVWRMRDTRGDAAAPAAAPASAPASSPTAATNVAPAPDGGPLLWHPALHAHARMQHGGHAAKVTALKAQPQGAFIAAGLADGNVLLVRDVAALIASAETLPVQLRPKVARGAASVDGGSTEDAVTGLAFVQRPGATKRDAAQLQLLIVTVSQTLRYVVQGHGAGGAPAVVDAIGCAAGCVVPFQLAGAAVLARDEALYVVHADGRGASIALEGRKAGVQRLHGQLVVLSAVTDTWPGERPVSFGGALTERAVQMTIFDVDTKCVTYTAVFADGIQVVWSSADDGAARTDPVEQVTVLTRGGEFVRVCAKTLPEKLEQLFRMHLYLLAAVFVRARAARFPHVRLPTLPPSAVIIPPRAHDWQTPRADAVLVADILRRYGDFLYAKGDFEGAMHQFCRTIGVVSPSYVIRKFLDAQRLQYLTAYLQALHAAGLANADHTTLLLNCYTKLRDTDALDRFFAAAARAPAPLFDVQVAISAAYLAEEHGFHAEYLGIQLRDEHNVAAAIAYLMALGPAEAEQHVEKYAHVLLDGDARAATSLLLRIYTAPRADGTVPSPVPVFSHFIGHRATFVQFLEGVAEQRWAKRVRAHEEGERGLVASGQVDSTREGAPADECVADQRTIFDTLLELYLELHPARARELLHHPAAFPYTATHAMLLCAQANAEEWLLFLYAREGLTDAIMQHWIHRSMAPDAPDAERASRAVLDTLAEYGDASPKLFVTVLQFLTSSRAVLARHRRDFARVLAQIDERALLSPIEVVEIVSRNDVLEVGLLSEYLLHHVRNEREEVDGVRRLLESYRTETAAKEKELAALTSATVPRVIQNHRCALCREALDLPSVHFMCKHSFHLRCLPEGDEARECPLCARAHSTVLGMRRGREMLADTDLFRDHVHAADDGFDVVADMFASGAEGL